jgi:phospholipid transport system substrate-binding protein
MLRKFPLVFVILIAVAPIGSARAVDTISDPAAQQIQSFYASLLDTMKRGPQLGMMGRYKALGPAVDKAFDLTDSMRLIIGPSWATMSDADKNALVAAFRRMTIANYASNFDKYSGERFVVDPNVQTRGPDKLVQSQLVPQSGQPVQFIYRMRQSGDIWKVIDVYLAGFVSQAALKRSDFAATLAAQGPQGLASRINSIADASLAGAKTNP